VAEKIRLTIDGREVEAEPGSTILQAAEEAGIHIPVLCYFAHTTANGLCRLCVVEVEGARGLQAACVTEARDGAVIQTDSPNVRRVRKTILEMLARSVDLSEAPEIQAIMESLGAEPERFARLYPRLCQVRTLLAMCPSLRRRCSVHLCLKFQRTRLSYADRDLLR